MKKIIITLVSSIFLLFGNANAISFNIGGSLTGGVFSVDGASEKNESVTKNASSEGEDAEGLYAIGSIFTELGVTDKIAIGVDYVPHALETNKVENTKEGNLTGVDVTNTAEVHIEDMYTVYASLFVTDNIYVKAGYTQADVLTKEVLKTGGAYPDTDIDGLTVGLGYDKDLAGGMFIRMEANFSEFDSVQVTNSNDTTKKVTVDGVSGYGARLSIGKSF